MKLPVHAGKQNSVTLVTVMIWFQKGSISIVIVSDNKYHDKRTVVPYLFTVFNYLKKVFREKTQNINTWTDMAHLVNLKISLLIATLVITFLSCFFIIIMQHGIFSYKSWKGGLDGLGGTIK